MRILLGGIYGPDGDWEPNLTITKTIYVTLQLFEIRLCES